MKLLIEMLNPNMGFVISFNDLKCIGTRPAWYIVQITIDFENHPERLRDFKLQLSVFTQIDAREEIETNTESAVKSNQNKLKKRVFYDWIKFLFPLKF